MIDLKKYFGLTTDYGLDITVVPQLQYQRNDKLINLTKGAYDELTEMVSKFPSNLDSELLKETDRYIKSSLPDKSMLEIKVKEDLKISDMNFKNPKLKKLSEPVKRRRIELYMIFNQFFLKLMPLISLDDKFSAGDLSKQFMSVKNMILFSMKNKAIQKQVENLPTGNQGYVTIKRRQA